MSTPIAVVGMACRYPDAHSPEELWESVLAQRRSFRRIPPERLRLEDYASEGAASDSIYLTEAALIEGYEFDRVRFRVSGNAFRSADLAHWLALDVAARALEDAGFADGGGLPRQATGVVVGNTLTGEFSRSNTLRLRFPYVRRVLEKQLVEEGWASERRSAFLRDLEERYKAPFPPVTDETLAGGLSNTISGRICNYFDLNGGGYNVDGACAASLLAVINACAGLAAGDLDVALAGGVDLSLDPFELVGFSRLGALAPQEMRVYDARSAGFWPGEGCGFVVLMRLPDAVADRRRIRAVIPGWGISSDGSGGITRPEVEGQLLAVRRAYCRAGFAPSEVSYIEGHGTGTKIGDSTELEVFSRALGEAPSSGWRTPIGSVKANIGHTKAAAGIAGLIKATMALRSGVLPPNTGCEAPHPLLIPDDAPLRILEEPESWPERRPRRAGVSAMGFGGINTHVVLEGSPEARPQAAPRRLTGSSLQDAELFLLGAPDHHALRQQVERLGRFAARLSRAELGDLAAELATRCDGSGCRAAIVASTPAQLSARLEQLVLRLREGHSQEIDVQNGCFLGAGGASPRVVFLFPGQGSPTYLTGGAWARRFPGVRDLYRTAGLPVEGDLASTRVAQPAIVAGSLAGLAMLRDLGVRAEAAVGHSLGELTALHWGGSLDEAGLLRVAKGRGRAMAELGDPTGAMASIGAGPAEVIRLIDGQGVGIAGLNSPSQTVVSGTAEAVERVIGEARHRGLRALRLPVSHAFHSSLVAAAVPPLAEYLRRELLRPAERHVVSTVTGALLAPDTDLVALLCRQVTSPVRFTEAAAQALAGADLAVEVGPGRVLAGLLSSGGHPPVVALDAGGTSLQGLLQAAGAAFALGAPVETGVLFAGRHTRPFDLDWQPRFFCNPCELAPDLPPAGRETAETAAAPTREPETHAEDRAVQADAATPLGVVRALVAAKAELPLQAVRDEDRLLGDLHLNSIAVGQLAVEACRALGAAPPVAPTEYADMTVARLALALAELPKLEEAPAREETPAGIDAWVRPFRIELVERPLARRPQATGAGSWRLIAPTGHPLEDPLQSRLGHLPGDGVMVLLPADPDERHVGLLLQGAHAARASGAGSRFALVQQQGGAASFMRTFFLEMPDVLTRVVDVPFAHPEAVEWVAQEVRSPGGYSESHYDAAGRRRQPILRFLSPDGKPPVLPFGRADVLLVAGGGKGIAAECVLELARETGVALALLGRSLPETDEELSANLARMAASGLRVGYYRADLMDPKAVGLAIRRAERELGPITAVLHAAARNEPGLIANLDEAAVLETLAPKVRGLRNLLAAVDADRLHWLITCGSVIAQTGLPGAAAYALANEWLVRLTEGFQAQHPSCRCLAVEWSAWSSVGMAARLGQVEPLTRMGVTCIPPEEGARWLRQLLTARPPTSVVVTGRLPDRETLELERTELPLRRFLEFPRVYYPGVELVADAELSLTSDPYLDDHRFQGEPLVPGVIGLEAMAQAAMAVTGSDAPPTFEAVRFDRPLTAPAGATLRTAALVRSPGEVEVVLRSSETRFQVDHFRATCRFRAARAEDGRLPASVAPVASSRERVALEPREELYGSLLFQGKRFQRLRGYRLLRARSCAAEIAAEDADWVGPYLPPILVLGDPGVRDACLHAIQPCIPHRTLLPTGVDRIEMLDTTRSGPLVLHARERLRDGETFLYDLALADAAGRVCEYWEGLVLRAVGAARASEPWAPALIGPYVERRLEELLPAAGIRVAFEEGSGPGSDRSSGPALRQILDEDSPILRRPDGKLEVPRSRRRISAAHAADLTLAVAGDQPVGCDLETVVLRSASVWRDLLGPDRFELAALIAREAGEDDSLAATRVWTALECLKKAGAPLGTPVVLASVVGDGWVLLRAGARVIATCPVRVRERETLLALGVLTGRQDRPCEPTSIARKSASRRQIKSETSTL